jgi:hypothetical protein
MPALVFGRVLTGSETKFLGGPIFDLVLRREEQRDRAADYFWLPITEDPCSTATPLQNGTVCI